jgi:hypothetical protein
MFMSQLQSLRLSATLSWRPLLHKSLWWFLGPRASVIPSPTRRMVSSSSQETLRVHAGEPTSLTSPLSPLLTLHSYLVRLKEIPTLRHRMGVAGQSSVSDKGVKKVVQDLLSWYQRGKQNRIERGFVGVSLRLFILLFTVPFAIVSIAGYEFVVRLSSPPLPSLRTRPLSLSLSPLTPPPSLCLLT